MPESYIQLPADSSGKKMRTRQRTISAQTVEEQFIALGAEPTYMLWTPSTACALNRFHHAVLNNAGSGQVLRVRKLFLCNAALAAVTGVGLQFDVKRISTLTGGTAITANPADTGDGALTNYTASHGGSGTEGVVLFSWYTNNDEIGLTGGFPQATIQALTSLLPEGPEIRELTLNPGEGFVLKQITSSTAGFFGVLSVITKST
ncbi:MAG TPA: hypothetical protein VFX80_02390 [Solirubrobacteraceae bacterium]|nr:hypothetical protein [Solirubrobacteraceae bacterium]